MSSLTGRPRHQSRTPTTLTHRHTHNALKRGLLGSVSLVSALTIRRGLRRHRRDLALIATVVALAGLIAAHHRGGLLEMDHEAGMGAIVEMCLGVFTAVGAVVVAAGLAVVVLRRHGSLPTLLSAGAGGVPRVPVARARHGPAAVSVLRVSRR